MLQTSYRTHRKAFWITLGLLLTSLLFCAGDAFASAATDLNAVAANITSNFSSLARLITAISYVAGLGFAVASIFKFKAHKDNPTQIPIGTPLALLFVGAALIFMPSVFKIAGQTIFGTTGGVGGASGTDPFAS